MKKRNEITERLYPPLFAVVPIVIFVLVVHFFFYRFETRTLIYFLIAAATFIVGQIVFLYGIDSSIVKMGEYVGNSSNKLSKFFIVLIFGFIFGLLSTVAEPDLQVFAGEAVNSGFVVPKILLMFGAGFGVGAFISLALYRIISKIPLNVLLFGSYAVLFILAFFVDELSFATSLDIGSTTTGVVTSPFLLAIGMGVARMKPSSKDSREDNFGLIALSSVGPIICVLILSLVFKGRVQSASETAESLPLWLETLKDVSFSLLPLLAVFFVFEVIFIKIPWREIKKLILGSIITFIGFYIYLFSIEFGFVDLAREIGVFLGTTGSLIVVIFVCSLLTFFTCYSEPSIVVLGEQVEKVTNGNIKSKMVVTTIAISLVISISLAVLRLFFEISILYIAIPVFVLAFILSFFTSKTFTALAFDSAGIASGTLCVAFIFPILLGIGESSVQFAYGAVAICSMIPIVVVQVFGIMYEITVKIEVKKTQKLLVSFSSTTDEFSNISALEIRHKELMEGNSNG